MLKEREFLEVPVEGKTNNISLVVYPQSSNAKVFEESEPFAGESRCQLLGGCTYAYELVDKHDGKNYQFETQNEIVNFHFNRSLHAKMGTFVTSIYVGSLSLVVQDTFMPHKIYVASSW